MIKALVGLLFHSISITADAVNNLSDAGSSGITLLGFKIAGKLPTPEHPYGHARMEYISGMVVSFIIILLGLQLMGSSFDKILHPQAVTISVLTYVVLVISILVKLWQGIFNRTVGSSSAPRRSRQPLPTASTTSMPPVQSSSARWSTT